MLFLVFLPSGFIGVDLFFVISGYLITKIILKDLNDGDFHFVQFFARRVKRLFPALLVVLVWTLLMGMTVLYQAEFNLDVPQLDFNPQTCLKPRVGWHFLKKNKCYVDRKLTESWKTNMKATVQKMLLQFPDVISFYPENYLCDKDRCWAKRDGLLLYEDDNHLSLDGGLWLGEKIFTNKSVASKP